MSSRRISQEAAARKAAALRETTLPLSHMAGEEGEARAEQAARRAGESFAGTEGVSERPSPLDAPIWEAVEAIHQLYSAVSEQQEKSLEWQTRVGQGLAEHYQATEARLRQSVEEVLNAQRATLELNRQQRSEAEQQFERHRAAMKEDMARLWQGFQTLNKAQELSQRITSTLTGLVRKIDLPEKIAADCLDTYTAASRNALSDLQKQSAQAMEELKTQAAETHASLRAKLERWLIALVAIPLVVGVACLVLLFFAAGRVEMQASETAAQVMREEVGPLIEQQRRQLEEMARARRQSQFWEAYLSTLSPAEYGQAWRRVQQGLASQEQGDVGRSQR